MEGAVSTTITLGTTRLRCRAADGLGLIVEGTVDDDPAPTPYLDAVFADPITREAFFELVDHHGLIVARQLSMDMAPYRPVRGKRTRGRPSQGEFYHHDGCSTPVRPRIVEIRCPPQQVVRAMGTSVAPFPDLVEAMVQTLSPSLRRALDEQSTSRSLRDAPPEERDWEALQGAINRVIRALGSESIRAWFHEVDQAVDAFREPWSMNESRFMANHNAGRTVQHRRACHPDTPPGTPNGALGKRWPNEELAELDQSLTQAG